LIRSRGAKTKKRTSANGKIIDSYACVAFSHVYRDFLFDAAGVFV